MSGPRLREATAGIRCLLLAGRDALGASWVGEASPDVLVIEADPNRDGSETSEHQGPAASGSRTWMLLSGLDQEAEARLAAAMAFAPEAVLLAGAVGRRDVEHLAAKLAVAEALRERPDGSTAIVPVLDSAAGVLALPSLGVDVSRRLAGIAFDGARLAGSLGCGPEAAALSVARGSTLLAAASAGVPAVAIERGPGSRLAHATAQARQEGFAAVLVDRPEAVAIVFEAFRLRSDGSSRTSSRGSRRNTPDIPPA